MYLSEVVAAVEVVVLRLKDPQQAEEVAEAPAGPKPSFEGYHLHKKQFHVKYEEESFHKCSITIINCMCFFAFSFVLAL